MKAKVYIEGGAPGKVAASQFRRSWRTFFESAGGAGANFDIIRGQSREATWDRFLRATQEPIAGELPILVVDSESSVAANRTSWHHLEAQDSWQKPQNTSDDQAFLMVQLMETWFLADLEALRAFFGPKFSDSHLKGLKLPESVEKARVLDGLERATRNCSTRFKKGTVAFELLFRIDPKKIEAACPHAKRLLDRLRSL